MSERSPSEALLSSRRDSKLTAAQESAIPQGSLQRVIKWSFNPRGRGPDLLRTIFVVNPALMLPFVILMGGLEAHFLRRYLFALLIGETVSLTCMLMRTVIVAFAEKILRLRLNRRARILSSLVGMLPGMWFGFGAAVRVARILGQPFDPPQFPDYGIGMTIGSLVFGVVVLIDLWNVARTEAVLLENENLQAKLSALSAQMNPHLLFNALNTIASTISSNPGSAEETTIKLSELYRGILKSSQRASHRLSDELELCRAYLGIESARFGDRIRWSIELDPQLAEAQIPSLLIQPLVENAIKHGLSQRAEGGTLQINVSRLSRQIEIVVKDDGVGWGNSSARNGTGTGVSSCKSRLELAYAGNARFEIGSGEDGRGTTVRILIPERNPNDSRTRGG